MLRSVSRAASLSALALAAIAAVGCQSPTDADEAIEWEDVVDVNASPNPIFAGEATDGRTYRVTRNNQPDDVLKYDWHANFSVTVSFNQNALDDDVDVDFPVRLTSTSLAVKQASGGVITPPTGSDTEHYDFASSGASGNSFSAVGNAINISFEIWYDLPSLRREAVVTLTLAFADDDGATFQRTIDIQVAP